MKDESTDAEDAALRELGRDLAAAMHSEWEPRCIAAAFASSSALPAAPSAVLAFTMQAWIELEALRSSLLQGEPPETVEDFNRALLAFGLPDDAELDGAESAVMALEMVRAVSAGFSTALKMNPPEGNTADGDEDGFGRWLPTFACLVTQCGLSPAEARAMRVDQAFALIAGMRHNQGWRASGVAYALREMADAETRRRGDTERAESSFNLQPSSFPNG